MLTYLCQARVRKEFLAAKGFEEAEEVDEEAIKKLTLQGDEIKRLVKRNDKTGAYDSDEDEDNPYAVSVLPSLSNF